MRKFRISHQYSDVFKNTVIMMGNEQKTIMFLNTHGTQYTKIDLGKVSVLDYVDIISNDERFEVTEI